jgi:hypothetical protein
MKALVGAMREGLPVWLHETGSDPDFATDRGYFSWIRQVSSIPLFLIPAVAIDSRCSNLIWVSRP